MNGAIRSMEGGNVVVFDAHAVLANEGGTIDPAYSRDQLHLNDAGHGRLNEGLVAVLTALE